MKPNFSRPTPEFMLILLQNVECAFMVINIIFVVLSLVHLLSTLPGVKEGNHFAADPIKT